MQFPRLLQTPELRIRNQTAETWNLGLAPRSESFSGWSLSPIGKKKNSVLHYIYSEKFSTTSIEMYLRLLGHKRALTNSIC